MNELAVYTPQSLAPATSAGPTFYLGTHHPGWLSRPEFADVPLFVSRNRLTKYKTMPKARGRWALDSGGFTELKTYGRWRLTAREYVSDVRRILDGVGKMPDFVAPQDWMTEPWVVTGQHWHLSPKDPKFFHGTRAARGLGPTEVPGENEQPFDEAAFFHIQRTVENALELHDLAPEVPWLYVLQGWKLDHYKLCADLYAAAGVDLTAQPVVGLGSVCRRQSTEEIGQIVNTFAFQGIRLHGFGVKLQGLSKYGHNLASADSMAWSTNGRRSAPLPGHEVRHKNCANCPDFAMQWRGRVLDVLDGVTVRQTVHAVTPQQRGELAAHP